MFVLISFFSQLDRHAFKKGYSNANVLQGYIAEDMAHMDSWFTLYSFLHGGAKPLKFVNLPYASCAAPELVIGRIYPVVCGNERGVVCISPGGRSFVRVEIGDNKIAVGLDKWALFVRYMEISVGPLIHRSHAVVVYGDELCVLEQQHEHWSSPHEDLDKWDDSFSNIIHSVDTTRQFLDDRHRYAFTPLISGEQTYVDWEDMSDMLLPLGSYILVEVDVVKRHVPSMRAQPSSITHVLGCLRYPDECGDPPPSLNVICVAFQRISEVVILYLKPSECTLFDSANVPSGAYIDILR